MKFEPRLPDDSPNLPSEHPLLEASWLFAALGVVAVMLTVVAVFVVELSVAFVPLSAERELFAVVEDSLQLDHGAEQAVEIERLLGPVVAQWPDDPYDHRLFVLENDLSVNAFAYPGGSIGVTQGLADRLSGDPEAMTFILAHEVGHFRNRDHLRGIGRQAAFGLMAFSLGLGGVDGSLHEAVNSSMGRSLSVEAEAEADAFAFEVLCALYGDTAGARRAFEAFPHHEGVERVVELMSDHPTTPARIQAAVAFGGS